MRHLQYVYIHLRDIHDRADEHTQRQLLNSIELFFFKLKNKVVTKKTYSIQAGVYAVRAGPVLSCNLASHMGVPGHTRLEYTPQNDFLKLIVSGKGEAFGTDA